MGQPPGDSITAWWHPESGAASLGASSTAWLNIYLAHADFRGGTWDSAARRVAAARGDHEAVLDALDPVRWLSVRSDLGTPETLFWQDVCGDALITTG